MISTPDNWPTHTGESAFWEELGRAVVPPIYSIYRGNLRILIATGYPFRHA